MPSSQFFHIEAFERSMDSSDPDTWDWTGETNWLPGTYDEIQSGLGDTSIRMSETGFVQCSDGSYASGVDACPSSSSQCAPGEVQVTSKDWAGPVCMTADMAVAYGRGLQTQSTPSIPWGLIAVSGVGLLLLGAVGGRRR